MGTIDSNSFRISSIWQGKALDFPNLFSIEPDDVELLHPSPDFKRFGVEAVDDSFASSGEGKVGQFSMTGFGYARGFHYLKAVFYEITISDRFLLAMVRTMFRLKGRTGGVSTDTPGEIVGFVYG